MKVDWLIVGAGYTGCVLAERIASQLEQEVLLVESRDHIGGNAYDYFDEHGILVHKYGPHIFHTNSKKIWDYLSHFTDWRPYSHHVLAVVDGKKVPVPFNLNSLHALFPENTANNLESLLIQNFGLGEKIPILKLRETDNPGLKYLADFIYQKIFYGYTTKQWDLTPEELDPSVTARVPVFISRDDRYFQDTYQAMPLNGYTAMFQNMVQNPKIKVFLNTDYNKFSTQIIFRKMIYTGPIDSFFGFKHGHLPYRSLDFNFSNHNQDYFQETGQINYPNDDLFTRITEFKHLTGQKINRTTVAIEYPQPYTHGKNLPYYPIPKKENRDLFERYLNEARKLNESVIFAGRLADYQYYNMDQSVGRALYIFENKLKNQCGF